MLGKKFSIPRPNTITTNGSKMFQTKEIRKLLKSMSSYQLLSAIALVAKTQLFGVDVIPI